MPTPSGGHVDRDPPAINRLPDALVERIEIDPVFQVVTDDFFWIDPFSGEAVPATEGRVEAAMAYLLRTGVWQFGEPMTRQELDIIRWRHDLVPKLKAEVRLRLFTRDGRWVNPYTGELVSGIRREEGRITDRSILDLARALAACPQAANGLMLDIDTLRARVRAAAIQAGYEEAGPQVVTDSGDPLSRARNVQQWMLAEMPRLEGYDLAVHYAPCVAVGGDFYDILPLSDGRLIFVVGDVSGHGVEAALVVASSLSALRLLVREAVNAVDLLGRFNQEIGNDLMPGQFITLFAAELDPRNHLLTCVCAGHHPGMLFSLSSGTMLRRIGQQGMAIGLASTPVFLGSLHPETMELHQGDVLLQYTDGVVEAVDDRGLPFGEARVCGVSFFNLSGPMQVLVDAVAQGAATFRNNPPLDDVTVFSLSRLVPPSLDNIGTDEWKLLVD
jgi:serine phosphatase RsbU (regulator of sigma subunit)